MDQQRGGGVFDPHLFAVACKGEDAVVGGGQRGELLFSADGGATWAEQRGDGRDVYDLIAFDLDSEVLAIGDRGSLMMSRRSGAPGSWQTVPNAGAHTGQPWFGRGRSIGSEVLLVGQLRVERLSLDVIASVAATWRRE
ncbi:MAG: hypothetical protein AB7N53_15895 [Candidatus Binatia bacterium]